MTFEEAETIRQMIDGHWSLRMNDPTSDLWLQVLLPEDAQEATAVVAYMAQRMHYSPKIADFREVMRLLHPPKWPTAEIAPAPEEKRGVAAPEWVWVWSWARYQREPRNLIPFPQQEGHVDQSEMMSMDEYEKLRDEWLKANSPKAAHPIPAMKGRT